MPLLCGSGKTSEAQRNGKAFLSQSVNADSVQNISTLAFSPPMLTKPEDCSYRLAKPAFLFSCM